MKKTNKKVNTQDTPDFYGQQNAFWHYAYKKKNLQRAQ